MYMCMHWLFNVEQLVSARILVYYYSHTKETSEAERMTYYVSYTRAPAYSLLGINNQCLRIYMPSFAPPYHTLRLKAEIVFPGAVVMSANIL